jgi:Concanavalin A-like lectin/glucanases superfamily
VWELICHQTYDWHGLPIDRSLYDNHGSAFGVQVLADGAAAGSGALRLGSGSAISVQLNPACRTLRAVRVECTLRLTDPQPAKRMLVDCGNSFQLFIFSSGLWALHAVQPDEPGIYFGVFGFHGFHNDGISTVSDGLGGGNYQVPLGQWVNVVFEHDGIAAMRLYADGQKVAERHQVLAGIRDAGAVGLRIGNAGSGADECLGGDIDEIKLWRLDPQALWREFSRRPLDAAAAACWHDFLLRIDEILRAHPDCARLLGALRDIVERMLRTVAAHGPGAVGQLVRFGEDYRALWRAGAIDGSEMANLTHAWTAWLRGLGVNPEADAMLQALIRSDCFRRLWETSPGLACDAAFLRMIGLFVAAASGRSPAAGA